MAHIDTAIPFCVEGRNFVLRGFEIRKFGTSVAGAICSQPDVINDEEAHYLYDRRLLLVEAIPEEAHEYCLLSHTQPASYGSKEVYYLGWSHLHDDRNWHVHKTHVMSPATDHHLVICRSPA